MVLKNKARKVKFNFDLLKDTDLENGDRFSIKCQCGHKIEVTQFLEAQDKKTRKNMISFFKENPCLIAWDNPLGADWIRFKNRFKKRFKLK